MACGDCPCHRKKSESAKAYDGVGMLKTLNIIGAGRVARTLGTLWRQQGVFAIGDVCSRTPQSAQDAVAFIGAGHGCETIRAMRPAEAWFIATPDDVIARVAAQLGASVLRVGDVVFHCSGALPANALRATLRPGVQVASVHPLKSFADPDAAVRTFSGTYCAAEGDAAALALLKPAFQVIGALVTEIDPQFKTLYHAASVLVCNDLTALMEAGLRCFEKAGLPRTTATAMMAPLVRETLDNVFKLGTTQALTGPVARGDHAVVARQIEALQAFDPRIAEIYRALGVITIALSRAQGGATATALDIIESALRANTAG